MACFDCHEYLFFKTIDKADSKLDWKIKETLHINGKKKQEDHLALTLLL